MHLLALSPHSHANPNLSAPIPLPAPTDGDGTNARVAAHALRGPIRFSRLTAQLTLLATIPGLPLQLLFVVIIRRDRAPPPQPTTANGTGAGGAATPTMPAVPASASSIAAKATFRSARQQQRAAAPASPASSPTAARVRGGAHRTIPPPIPTYLDAGVAAQPWGSAASLPRSARRSCGSGFVGSAGAGAGGAGAGRGAGVGDRSSASTAMSVAWSERLQCGVTEETREAFYKLGRATAAPRSGRSG
jgi:hypothetical protein